MLGEPHRPQRRGPGAARVELGGLADRLRRNRRNARAHLRGVGRHAGLHLVEVVHPCRDELLVVQPRRDDVVEHAVVQRHVGAGEHLQVDVGQLGQLGAPHVGHDQPGALAHAALDQRTEDGMGLGGVGARDEDDVARLLDLPHRARGRRGVERPLHGRHGR